MNDNKKVVHMHIDKSIVVRFKKKCIDEDVTMTKKIEDLMRNEVTNG
mgnify:CR=1 FL=1